MKRKTIYLNLSILLICQMIILVSPTWAEDEMEEQSSIILVHLARANQSLGETVLQSEKAGAVVVKAGLDDIDNFLSSKKEAIVYRLLVIDNEKPVKQFIDPSTGKVVDSKLSAMHMLFEDDYDKTMLSSIKIPMSKAIQSVEKASEGQTFKAALVERDGLHLYMIRTINETGTSTYIVDSLTGKYFKQKNTHDHHDGDDD